VYNIGSGRMSTFDDVAAAVREIYPSFRYELKVEIKGGMVGFPYQRPAPSDMRAAESELGFKVRYNLRDSMELFARHLAGN